MAERIYQKKKEGKHVFVDAGNAFFSGPQVAPSRKSFEIARADLIARSYQAMGLLALAPGENDFAEGPELFWALVKKSGAVAVSANLEESKERGVFKPYLVWNDGAHKIVITGLSSFDLGSIPEGIKQSPAREAIRALWRKIESEKADQVVMLSHLGRKEDEEVAKEFPGIFIVGSKTLDFLESPKKAGNSFIFEVGIEGQRLGEIVLEKGTPGWATATLTELGVEYDKPNDVKKLVQEFKKKKREKK